MCSYFLYLIFTFYSCFEQTTESYTQNNIPTYDYTDKINGVTLDAVNGLNNIVATLSRHNRKMTVRIVFDEWVPALHYQNAVNRIDSVANIMGEILDSYYMSQYSFQQYKSRVEEYVELLGNKVDIWEIGNEANGEWLGHRDSVIAKIEYAFRYVKKSNKLTALTLYYNKDCWDDPDHEMFRWVNNNLPLKMKLNLDYVLVSYYEDNCNNYQPDWQQVFDSLRAIFPNAKLGIGECGTIDPDRKTEYIKRYYTMRISTPGYIGGYFWWYYKQDCVPWNTKPLWQVLETALNSY